MSLLSMLGPIGMGVDAASGIMGMIQSGAANKKNQALMGQQRSFLDQQYLPDLNKRFLDTDQAQSILANMRERTNTTNQQIEQTSAVTGGTDEAALASRDSNSANYSNQLNGLAAQGTAYHQNLQDRYTAGVNGLFSQQEGIAQQQSQSGGNIFSNAMGSMGQLAMAPMLKGKA